MKYITILTTYWKAQIVWRFDVMMSVLLTVSRILLAYILWGAIYDGRAEVAGLTFMQMLTYYIVVSFLRELDMSSSTCEEFAHRIRNGLFSAYLVRPASAQGHFFAQTAGVSAFYGMFQLLAAVLWVFVFRVKFALACAPFELIGALSLAGLGLLFMASMNYAISVLAFPFNDVQTFNMIKDNLMNFVTGTLVPLALLPAGVVSAMRALPFYYVAYLPSMIVIGRGTGEIGRGLATLALWTVFFLILGRATHEVYRKKYDGVGI
jgi:ABC-2 type transport system permease protein